MSRRTWVLLSLAAISSLTGCAAGSNAFSCQIEGDNIRGRVGFAANVNIVAGANVQIEWSSDGFTTITGRSTQPNMNGLVSVPYSVCIASGTIYQFRAYQDLNNNLKPDTGDTSGTSPQTISLPAAAQGTWPTAPMDIAINTQL